MKIDVFASGSGGNCYRLSDGSTAIMLECGIPKYKILSSIEYKISDISGVLMSHEHSDHSKAAKDLALLGLDIYSSAGTFRKLGLYGHHFKAIKALQLFQIGTLDIFPFDVQHDAAEPLGFVITSRKNGERVLFFTDTYYVKYRFKNVDIIMGEVNYSMKTISPDLDKSRKNRLFESHMSLENFIGFLKANDLTNVKKIYLLHLSDDNSDAGYFRHEVMKASGAEVIVC